jgi:hypothetical protein
MGIEDFSHDSGEIFEIFGFERGRTRKLGYNPILREPALEFARLFKKNAKVDTPNVLTGSFG